MTTTSPELKARVVIPTDPWKAMLRHFVRNFGGLPGPRNLCFVSEPGWGKTYAVRTFLRVCGLTEFPYTPAAGESDTAGEPARQLEELIRQADACENGGVVVIDDAHLTLGIERKNTTGTVNGPLVVGVLQAASDVPGSRSPVILMCNGTSAFTSSSLRAMRTEVRPWVVTEVEKGEMVGGLFPPLVDADVLRLVRHFPGRPIAFFADLARVVGDRAIDRWMVGKKSKEVIRQALRGRVRLAPKSASLSDLVQLGHHLLDQRAACAADTTEGD